MKFSYAQLISFLPTQKSAEEIAEALTQIGLEVDHLDLSKKDPLFTISLTPNLAHCTSVRGIARELAGYFNQHLKKSPSLSLEEKGPKISSLVQVTIEDPTLCPRYLARVIRGIKNRPSPPELREPLEACGFRSVNAVVDILNLLMLLYGQPMHAFDYDTLEGKKIHVRLAEDAEKLKTIDGKELFLTEKQLVIADAKKPIALAGVMGGVATEVSESTENILLESAYFLPQAVRSSAKMSGLQTEASYRFERGTDPLSADVVLDKAVAEILDLLGGEVAEGKIDCIAADFTPKAIRLRLPTIDRILGTSLSLNEVVTILQRIDLKVVTTGNDLLTVFVPFYRHDLHQEIDLVEEVARFYGYHHLKREESPSFRLGILPDAPFFFLEKKSKELLLRLGLTEFLTCDLISPKQAEILPLPASALIHVLNPSSEQQSLLRPSLLPGLLAAAFHNMDHRRLDIAAFEMGRVHTRMKEEYVEQNLLAIMLMGKKTPSHWLHKPTDFDFFSLKGMVEELFSALAVTPSFQRQDSPLFHPHRNAEVWAEGRLVGAMGQLHPHITSLHTPLYFAELDIDVLIPLLREEKQMKALPIYPSTFFDWTVTVREEVTAEELLHSFDRNRYPLLDSFSLLDLYQGERLGSDWKNITLRFVYRDPAKTMAFQTAENCHKEITNSIRQNLKEKAKDE